MRFGSVFSGIEAASVAFNGLGWRAAWFSEIEKFPCELLEYHYPGITNYGDATLLPDMIRSGNTEAPEMLVGGTPCQAFSVAGKRLSLEDMRGNLTLTFTEIANAIDSVRTSAGKQPSIVFWENVPGVLNTKDNAFGCFLGALAGEDVALEPPGGKWTNAGCVFGPKRTVAWRILDAQYFGVAQRRRRVFVVASAREDISPVEILFEFDGMRRDSAPSREARKEVARAAGECFTASSFAGYREGVGTLRSSGGDLGGGSETLAVIPFNKQRIGEYSEDDIASTCAARDYKDATDLVCCSFQQNASGELRTSDIAYTIGTNSNASGRNTPMTCYSLQGNMIGRSENAGPQGPGINDELCFTQTKADIHAVAYGLPGNWIGRKPENGGNATEPMYDVAPCQTKTDVHAVASNMQVRRLTPIECERLQGFPDGYTDIKPNGKPTPDGVRYKALGNSWAVPNVRWIAKRIKESLDKE